MRRGDDSGAAAVEFAIVLPVLLLLVVGMIEFAFVMRDNLSTSSAVRTGVRTAITGAADGCVAGTAGTSSCVPSLTQAAANSVEKGGLGMPKNSINYILVYKANNLGFPGANGVSTMATKAACGTTVANCVAFIWDQTANSGAGGLVYSSGGWNSQAINACLPITDQVGVFMSVDHPYITRLFGATLTVSDRAVMRFQPLDPTSCGPNNHL